MIRLYQLTSGAVLDRRIVEELFLEAASRVSNLTADAFGDKVITRANVLVNALDDFEFNRDHSLFYNLPDFPARIPASNVKYRVQDSFSQYTLGWSIEVQAKDQDGKFILGWPVVNGEAVWGLLDYRVAGQLLKYDTGGEVFPTPDDLVAGDSFNENSLLTLGTMGAVDGLNGVGDTSVMVMSLGNFQIKKSSIRMGTRAR